MVRLLGAAPRPSRLERDALLLRHNLIWCRRRGSHPNLLLFRQACRLDYTTTARNGAAGGDRTFTAGGVRFTGGGACQLRKCGRGGWPGGGGGAARTLLCG